MKTPDIGIAGSFRGWLHSTATQIMPSFSEAFYEILNHFNSSETDSLRFFDSENFLTYAELPEIANSGNPVLIIGETGTGKELVADRIRKEAGIPDNKYIKVNCAAISKDLIESELFGHEKGAFTGAINQHKGFLEMADSGAIFLDEISTLPEHTQAKLLRTVQEGDFIRVGGCKNIKIKTLIIAATNKPEKIRDDLKWRFTHKVNLKPLRERRTDILSILHGSLPDKKTQQWVIAPWTFTTLLFSPFPGNVREIKNWIKISINRWEYENKGKKEKDKSIRFFLRTTFRSMSCII